MVRDQEVVAVAGRVVAAGGPVPRAVPDPSVRPCVGFAAIALSLVCVVPTVAVHVAVQRVAYPVAVVVGWLGEAAPPEGAAGSLFGIRPLLCCVLICCGDCFIVVISVGVDPDSV